MRRILRLLLAASAAEDLVIGAYAFLAPRSFFDNVVGHALGPYNEHLMTDVGGFFLAFAVLFAWAARSLSPDLVRAACTAGCLATALHFGYHALHLEGFDAGTAIVQTIGLAFAVALPAAALLIASRRPGSIRAAELGTRARTGAG